MAAPTPVPLDPASIITAFFVGLVGPELAQVIGAYGVILFAASVGAAWSLSRKDDAPNPAWFMLRINGAAMLMTWLVAKAAQWYWSIEVEITWLLGPIAFIIGVIGDDWIQIGKWVIDLLGGGIKSRIEGLFKGRQDGGSK